MSTFTKQRARWASCTHTAISSPLPPASNHPAAHLSADALPTPPKLHKSSDPSGISCSVERPRVSHRSCCGFGSAVRWEGRPRRRHQGRRRREERGGKGEGRGRGREGEGKGWRRGKKRRRRRRRRRRKRRGRTGRRNRRRRKRRRWTTYPAELSLGNTCIRIEICMENLHKVSATTSPTLLLSATFSLSLSLFPFLPFPFLCCVRKPETELSLFLAPLPGKEFSFRLSEKRWRNLKTREKKRSFEPDGPWVRLLSAWLRPCFKVSWAMSSSRPQNPFYAMHRLPFIPVIVHVCISLSVCVCVCVRERERERERVCARAQAQAHGWNKMKTVQLRFQWNSPLQKTIHVRHG